jgi:hypothetical protein
MAKMEPLDPRVQQVHKELKVPLAYKEIRVYRALKARQGTTDRRAGISMEMG